MVENKFRNQFGHSLLFKMFALLIHHGLCSLTHWLFFSQLSKHVYKSFIFILCLFVKINTEILKTQPETMLSKTKQPEKVSTLLLGKGDTPLSGDLYYGTFFTGHNNSHCDVCQALHDNLFFCPKTEDS